MGADAARGYRQARKASKSVTLPIIAVPVVGESAPIRLKVAVTIMAMMITNAALPKIFHLRL